MEGDKKTKTKIVDDYGVEEIVKKPKPLTKAEEPTKSEEKKDDGAVYKQSPSKGTTSQEPSTAANEPEKKEGEVPA